MRKTVNKLKKVMEEKRQCQADKEEGRLKGVRHEIFDFSFLHESVSPGLLSEQLIADVNDAGN